MKCYDHSNFSRASVVQFRASRWFMSPNRTFVWKVMPFEFAKSFLVQILASRNIMSLNPTYEWKVMTIWISQELPLFNFERLDILCSRIGHPCENLGPFEFLESFRCSISRVEISYVHLNFSELQFWISNVSIYYGIHSDIRVKSYCHLILLRASVLNFVRLDMLLDTIRHPSKKLLSFEFA